MPETTRRKRGRLWALVYVTLIGSNDESTDRDHGHGEDGDHEPDDGNPASAASHTPNPQGRRSDRSKRRE